MKPSTLEAPENSQPTGTAHDSDAHVLTTTPHNTKTILSDATVLAHTLDYGIANHRIAAEPRALTVLKWSSWVVFVAIFTIVGIVTAEQMFGQLKPSAPGYVVLFDKVMLIAGGLLGALFGTMGSYLFSRGMARVLGYAVDEN